MASTLGAVGSLALERSRLSGEIQVESHWLEAERELAEERRQETQRLRVLLEAEKGRVVALEDQDRSLEDRLGLVLQTFAEVVDPRAGWRSGHALDTETARGERCPAPADGEPSGGGPGRTAPP